MAKLETIFKTWKLLKVIQNPYAVSMNVADRIIRDACFLPRQTLRTHFLIQRLTICEEQAQIRQRGKSDPFAFLVGFAKVQASKLIRDGRHSYIDTVSAFSSLETLVSQTCQRKN